MGTDSKSSRLGEKEKAMKMLFNPSLRQLALASFVMEMIHIFNSIPVKSRRPGWELNSFLDSYVIHTVEFMLIARYFRAFTIVDGALFVMLRIVAEGYLPKEYGGMMELKRHAGTMQDMGYFVSGTFFAIVFVMTMAILLREQSKHPQYIFHLAWGYFLTIMPAGKYLAYGDTFGYIFAHGANIIGFNPALVGLLIGQKEFPPKYKLA